MKLGSSPDMDTKRPRWSERSKPCHESQLTRRSQPPYPWPPEQAQPDVSKPCRTTVRDQKGVLRRCWEFPDDPDKGERHNVILMVDGRLQAKIEYVPRVELKVADGLIRDENAVRRRGELGEG